MACFLVIVMNNNKDKKLGLTVEGYNKPLSSIIVPYFKKNQNISIITEREIKDCISSVNGHRNKEVVYIVLKMFFDFAREHNYILCSKN